MLCMMYVCNITCFVFRFSDMFPDVQTVREVQNELDSVIERGVINIVELLNNKDENQILHTPRSPIIVDVPNNTKDLIGHSQEITQKNKEVHILRS